MIIDNPEVFKTWLTSILEPLCDADPAALAKYVYALVKKEKPIEELREGMLDQLDVFLQHETTPFVDMLFKSLDSKEYLKGEVEPEPAAEPEVPEPQPEPEVPASANGSNGTAPPEAPPAEPPRPRRVVLPRTAPKHEQTLVTKVPLTELLEEPLDTPPRRRDRRADSLREKEDRRRLGRSWERRGRQPRRRGSPRPEPARHENRSRSPSPRGRYRNRSPPPPERAPSRERSRSPLGSRKRPHERERERVRPPRELERDRMSRDRDHRDRASKSRDRSRSRSGSPLHESERLSPPPPAFKRRCRDFDEKGYCMRGDLCQWDHGADPLVLEDATLTRVLALPPAVPEYNPLAPDIWGGAPFPPYAAPPPRELVHIPRIRAGPPLVPPIAPPRPPAPRHPPPMKKIFDYNRLGPQRPQLNQGSQNCSLEVRKVPRGLNDITHLNNHFSKFGKIVNIQVCYEGDPEAALITFSNHTEANVAYKSTEAVLNNRFIKVFWHNHENKQENVPPPAPLRPAAQHPQSNHKVLINKDTRTPGNAANAPNNAAPNTNAATPGDKPAQKMETANGQEPKKPEPVKPLDKSKQILEMQKRAQTLLETQLRQQALLIDKLESGNIQGPQRSALMEAINSTQEGIEKLRKELLAYNKLIKQIQAQVKRPKTREEAQKEILDAELDLFTKQQEGQDVTELLKKVAELRRQMAVQFPTHPIGRRPHARGGRFNPATRLVRNHGAHPGPPVVAFSHQSVDRRPRALLLSGFEGDEVEGLTQHLQKFGEVTGKELNLAVPELLVQYRSRAQAELAFARARHYNERTLSVTWVANNKPIAPTQPPADSSPKPPPEGEAAPTPPAEAPQETQEDPMLRFDDEEEEETEDRSWRR